MPLPETLQSKDPCELGRRWQTDVRVLTLLLTVIAVLDRDPRIGALAKGLKIISGFRNREKQEALGRAGRPAAPWQLSTHTSCPATGVDIRLEGHMDPRNNPTDREIWTKIGSVAQSVGLRWGGGSPPMFSQGPFIPSDFNHFDLGRRNDQIAEAFRRDSTGVRAFAGLHDVPLGPEAL